MSIILDMDFMGLYLKLLAIGVSFLGTIRIFFPIENYSVAENNMTIGILLTIVLLLFVLSFIFDLNKRLKEAGL